MKKKKILAISDYANTGIGESLRNPLIHWHNKGHEINYLGLGYNGWCSQVDRRMYPFAERLMPIMDQFDTNAKFGQGSIVKALRATRSEYVITSFDVGMIRYLSEPHQDVYLSTRDDDIEYLNVRKRSFTHIAYFPLDGLVHGTDLPRHFDEMIAGMDVPVTYSDFAKKAVLRGTGFDIPMIPISHDPAIFHPGDKLESRRAIGFPEAPFIIAMIGTNQSRKLWPEFIRAAARIARRHSDVFILPWTTWDTQINGGFDIADLIYRENVNLQVINPGQAVHRFTDHQMANLYRSIDICVLTTVGEGAGLPPIRARACGTPALVSNNTSCTEFASCDFELISSKPSHTDNGNNLQRYATSIDQLEQRLQKLYDDRKKLKELGELGALKSKAYELEPCNEKWDALLESLS